MTAAKIKQFLAEHTTLTLATLGPDSQPQAAPLFFAEMDDLSLLFISEKKVRHSRNIEKNNRVAVTVYADGQSWQNIRGLQLEGHCTALSGAAARHARQVYLAKFPFIAQSKILAAMLHVVTFYKITPVWIRLTDNTQGFGHKDELRLP
jgi:uncharacterized protein YhbP (UPF0306 family)